MTSEDDTSTGSGDTVDPIDPAEPLPEAIDFPDAARLREHVWRCSSIRLERVEQVCRDLASGTYQPDSRLIADRMLDALAGSARPR